MKAKKAPKIGTRVRVHKACEHYTRLRGEVGTLVERYGAASRPVIGVWFPDGTLRLFWDHQLEVVVDELWVSSEGPASTCSGFRRYLPGIGR